MKKNYSNSSAVNTLSKKRDKLISRFLNEDELLFHELYSDLLDDYFRESFEKSFVGPDLNITKNPYAIIALGGYGRREQCIFSDVDVLFLFEKKVPEKAEDLIKEMAYPLWDIGLEVGHSTRNIKECVNLSKTDISVLTSLLDARFICGISNVYWALVEQIRCRAINRRSGRIIKQLLKLNEKRHENFGD